MRWMFVIGDSRASEAREVLGNLLAACPAWGVVRCGSIEDAVAREVPEADLVLVLQTRPGEFSSAGVRRLYDRFPLARFVVGLGAWCGSAVRREGMWPEDVVVPMWDVVARLRREMGEVESGVAGLPLTTGRDERALCHSESISLPSGMRVCVQSPDRALREWLADLVSEAGGDPFTNSNVRHADGVIWDVDPWEGVVPWEVRLRCPVVALVGLPTASVSRALRSAGATAVLGKPCDGGDVLRALGGLGLTGH